MPWDSTRACPWTPFHSSCGLGARPGAELNVADSAEVRANWHFLHQSSHVSHLLSLASSLRTREGVLCGRFAFLSRRRFYLASSWISLPSRVPSGGCQCPRITCVGRQPRAQSSPAARWPRGACAHSLAGFVPLGVPAPFSFSPFKIKVAVQP